MGILCCNPDQRDFQNCLQSAQKSFALPLSNNVKSIATGMIYSVLYRAAVFVLIPEWSTQMTGLVGSSY